MLAFYLTDMVQGGAPVGDVVQTVKTGGAVIVDIGKRKKKKSRVISEEEAQGMAAIYGYPMRDIPEIEQVPGPLSSEIIEPKSQFESILQPFDMPDSVFRKPDDSTPIVDRMLIDEQEPDDIALILAIIEAIG